MITVTISARIVYKIPLWSYHMEKKMIFVFKHCCGPSAENTVPLQYKNPVDYSSYNLKEHFLSSYFLE